MERKHGARVLFVVGGLVAGVGIMLVYGIGRVLADYVSDIWYFYVVMSLVWGFGQALLGGNIISGPIVSKWFVRKRGRAMALYAMGISGGGVVFVPLNAFLIDPAPYSRRGYGTRGTVTTSPSSCSWWDA